MRRKKRHAREHAGPRVPKSLCMSHFSFIAVKSVDGFNVPCPCNGSLSKGKEKAAPSNQLYNTQLVYKFRIRQAQLH